MIASPLVGSVGALPPTQLVVGQEIVLADPSFMCKVILSPALQPLAYVGLEFADNVQV